MLESLFQAACNKTPEKLLYVHSQITRQNAVALPVTERMWCFCDVLSSGLNSKRFLVFRGSWRLHRYNQERVIAGRLHFASSWWTSDREVSDSKA